MSKGAVYEWLKYKTFCQELKGQRDGVIGRALVSRKADIVKATET
jgi:hypothetical protein